MDFNEASNFTLDYEGGWVNDPDDSGGETYRGISRVNWPKWPGWSLVDEAKLQPNFPKNLFSKMDLAQLVRDFYRVNFWDKISGDQLPPEMAVAVFDFAVNSGAETAAKYLQIVLGVKVDGNIGPKTIKAAFDGGENAIVELLARRAKFLHEIMDNDPKKKKWAMNWFRRLFRLANIVLEG